MHGLRLRDLRVDAEKRRATYFALLSVALAAGAPLPRVLSLVEMFVAGRAAAVLLVILCLVGAQARVLRPEKAGATASACSLTCSR